MSISKRQYTSTLSNPILPLFRLENWEKSPWIGRFFTRTDMYPITTSEGAWSAHNPRVWEILQPILKLATRILMSADALPFLDALVYGERTLVPPERMPPGYQDKKFLCFHRRDVTHSQVDSSMRDVMFQRLVEDFNPKFGFMHPGKSPLDDGDFCSAKGVTAMSQCLKSGSQKLFTFLNFSLFEPLLSGSVDAMEKGMHEWYIAQILSHEVIHLIYKSLNQVKIDQQELYFEDEPLMELGLSFENAVSGYFYKTLPPPQLIKVLGGGLHPMRSSPSGQLFGLWQWTNYPTRASELQRNPDTPILVRPPLLSFINAVPLPASFVDSVRHDAFWDVGVTKFGLKVLRFGREGVGVRQLYDGSVDQIDEGLRQFQRQRDRGGGFAVSVRASFCMKLEELALHFQLDNAVEDTQ